MPPVRLFVGNLAYTVTDAELRELFSSVGQVTQVHLPVDRETGRPRGFAFVEFAERAAAEAAVEKFHNQLFQGRPLSVNEARERGSAPPPRPSGFSPRPPGPPSSQGPRTGFDRGPSWSPPSEEGDAKPSRARTPRVFGDAAKKKGKTDKFEKAPKGPIPVRGGGRIFSYDDDAEEDGDASLPFDDFARALPGEGPGEGDDES